MSIGDTIIGELEGQYSKGLLIEYAKANNITLPSSATEKLTKRRLLEKIIEERKDANKELNEIEEFRKRIRLSILEQKAKELKVYEPDLEKRSLAIRIYSKDPQSLRDLHLYQSSEPKKSTLTYLWKDNISYDKIANKDLLQPVIEKAMREGNEKIATLDSFSHVGEEIRFVITVDSRHKVFERKEDDRFPGRKGPHVDFPVRTIIGSINKKNNNLKISGPQESIQLCSRCLSEFLVGNADAFQLETPSMACANRLLMDGNLREALNNKGISVVGLTLQSLSLEGGVSKLHMEGDNLLLTLDQFRQARIPIIGSNISEIAYLTLMWKGKKISIDFTKAKRTLTGIYEEDERETIECFLNECGLYRQDFS